MRTGGVRYGKELDTLSYILHYIAGKVRQKTNAFVSVSSQKNIFFIFYHIYFYHLQNALDLVNARFSDANFSYIIFLNVSVSHLQSADDKLTLFQTTNLDSSRLRELADDNVSLIKMAEGSPKGWKTLWKTEILLVILSSFSFFPSIFSKDLFCRYVNTRACLGKG